MIDLSCLLIIAHDFGICKNFLGTFEVYRNTTRLFRNFVVVFFAHNWFPVTDNPDLFSRYHQANDTVSNQRPVMRRLAGDLISDEPGWPAADREYSYTIADNPHQVTLYLMVFMHSDITDHISTKCCISVMRDNMLMELSAMKLPDFSLYYRSMATN